MNMLLFPSLQHLGSMARNYTSWMSNILTNIFQLKYYLNRYLNFFVAILRSFGIQIEEQPRKR